MGENGLKHKNQVIEFNLTVGRPYKKYLQHEKSLQNTNKSK